MHKTLIFWLIPPFEIQTFYAYCVTLFYSLIPLLSSVPFCYACDSTPSNTPSPYQELWFPEDRCPCDQSDDAIPLPPPLKREEGVSNHPSGPGRLWLLYLLCEPLPPLPPQDPRQSQPDPQPFRAPPTRPSASTPPRRGRGCRHQP